MGQSCCKSEEPPGPVTVQQPPAPSYYPPQEPPYPMQPQYPMYPPLPVYPPLPMYPQFSPPKPDVIIYINGREAYRWVSRAPGRPLPMGAVRGGRDTDGSEIYVGRAFHEGDMIPAKIIPDKEVAFVCWNGEEHPKHDYEVLCQGDFGWEFCSNGSIPEEGAVVGGQTADGEPLYIGRVLHSGSQTIGKVQQSHGCLYIPYEGEELSFKDYEVLVVH